MVNWKWNQNKKLWEIDTPSKSLNWSSTRYPLWKRKKNGAVLNFIGEKEIEKLVPEANITTGRALWSPNTSVINPISVIDRLQSKLKSKGVKI